MTWLNSFGAARAAISRIELDDSTIKDFLIVRAEGGRRIERPISHYGLDVAFYVGYRVNSSEGKLFRRWATNMLVQLATKGFVVNVRKLKGEPDHFAELRKIIQDIRADEANLYAEIRRILAMCKDYDPHSKASNNFFAEFQNRLLYAITGHTAAEIIVERADGAKPYMGLMAWKVANRWSRRTTSASSRSRISTGSWAWSDFFEDQTKREFLVSMDDAEGKLGEILAVNKRLMLHGLGRVRNAVAEAAEHAREDRILRRHDRALR